jgi:hypothetical protein
MLILPGGNPACPQVFCAGPVGPMCKRLTGTEGLSFFVSAPYGSGVLGSGQEVPAWMVRALPIDDDDSLPTMIVQDEVFTLPAVTLGGDTFPAIEIKRRCLVINPKIFDDGKAVLIIN